MVDGVTVRGIYATALTARLGAEHTIVSPSPVIRDRFDRSFPLREPVVTIRDATDRQGVEVAGQPAGVKTLRETVASIGETGLTWESALSRGAIVDGVVTETVQGGAVLDLGVGEGYLPFGATEAYVDSGDVFRVQVKDPMAPWVSRRHRVTPTVEVEGVVVSLVRGIDSLVAKTPEDGTDLARTTELLDVDIPDEWGVRWEHPAMNGDLQALESALETIVTRGETMTAELEDVPETTDGETAPRIVSAPQATGWVRFGRGERFTLDADRRDVISTLPGHHRIKAGSDTATTAVDFAERLQVDIDTFPFEAVTDQFGPRTGETVRIAHGKPDGDEYDLGQGIVTDRNTESQEVTVEREIQSDGTYDALDTPKAAGDTAVTSFREGRWWYPTTYRSVDGDLRGTYVNVNTPIEVYPDAIRYVDLYVDVVKWPDGDAAIVDTDELDAAVDSGVVPEPMAERGYDVASNLRAALGESSE